MNWYKTANYKKMIKNQALHDKNISQVQETEMDIPLYKDGTDILENVSVNVEWSVSRNGKIAIHTVKDAIFGKDYTDLVYDLSNKEILNKIKSEINDIIGNMEQDIYDEESYNIEQSRDTHKNYGDGYEVEDTSPYKDPNDRPRNTGKNKSYQSYPNLENNNHYTVNL